LLNEVPAGTTWHSNQERFEMLEEAIMLIKLLWLGDWVTFHGRYYWVKNSNLYIKPLQPIPMFIAGIGPQSVRLADREADGFVTNEANPELIENRLLSAFRDGALKASRNPKQ
jgi:coenzyme F420-dependent glucose-6-phosphate dehydrogenase